MDPTVILGVVIGISLLLNAIGIDMGLKLFFHPPSIMIVLGGTLGATMVHFPITQIFKLGPRLRVIFSFRSRNYKRDIDKVAGIAEKVKKEGRMSINNEIPRIKDHFLRNALQLLIDKVSPDHLERIMEDNIAYMKQRHDQGIRFFEQMAKYAPGFGLLGTLIGLIMLLAQLEDPKTVGPNMSVALVTTFYGVLLSNLVFLPLSGRLRISSNEEIIQKEMMLAGIVALAKGESGYIIREKMSMLLPERERKKLYKKSIKTKKA
jgi:chemotaxis protein MotA